MREDKACRLYETNVDGVNRRHETGARVEEELNMRSHEVCHRVYDNIAIKVSNVVREHLNPDWRTSVRWEISTEVMLRLSDMESMNISKLKK
jgi:hypothetical protein